LGCSRFARRYSGNRICFLFLQVLRCFSSLGLSQPRYEFTRLYCPIKGSGFPHSEIPGSKLTYSSPRHIGVSAVLHRLLVPRHPPCALSNLTKLKSGPLLKKDGRVLCVALFCVSMSCIQFSKNKVEHPAEAEPSKPNAKRQLKAGGLDSEKILRKEVIQPHLPIRLPCYDFTPIICPTFGGWLPRGYLTDFGCYKLSWCDGRCVQGPGTYSPWHADPRLLAIPASCRRVAACNPN
jgi:hypothetical protein